MYWVYVHLENCPVTSLNDIHIYLLTSKRDGSQMALGFHEIEVCPLLAHIGSSDCHTGEPSQPSKKWLHRYSAHFKDLAPYSDGVAAATSGRVRTQRDFVFFLRGGGHVSSLCVQVRNTHVAE